MWVWAVKLTTPRGWDCVPSTSAVGGCAYAAMRASLGALLILVGSTVVATIAGQWIHRTDPRLLRAACASKTASYQARSLVSMASIPRRSEVIPKVTASWDAEARAWADYGEGCE